MNDDARWNHVAELGDTFGSLLGPANEKFLELGKLFPGATVLDVGCGTGALVRAAARLVGEAGRIAGIDASDAMIARAKTLSAEHPNVGLYVHDARELKFADESCDVVFSRFGLEMFADPAAVVSRIHAVLKPGGRLVVMTLGHLDHNAFFTAAGPLVAPYVETALALGAPGRLETLLKAAGYSMVKVRPIRALVKVTERGAYWTALRAVLGIPPGTAPAIAPGAQLSLSLQFALAEKAGATTRQTVQVESFERVHARARMRIRELSPYEVQKNLRKENVYYIDVREPEEWSQGIVKGALRIPRGELEERLAAELPQKPGSIVTYSQDGSIGALAAARLVELGYSDVWNLAGGYAAWTQERMPISKPPFR